MEPSTFGTKEVAEIANKYKYSREDVVQKLSNEISALLLLSRSRCSINLLTELRRMLLEEVKT